MWPWAHPEGAAPAPTPSCSSHLYLWSRKASDCTRLYRVKARCMSELSRKYVESLLCHSPTGECSRLAPAQPPRREMGCGGGSGRKLPLSLEQEVIRWSAVSASPWWAPWPWTWGPAVWLSRAEMGTGWELDGARGMTILNLLIVPRAREARQLVGADGLPALRGAAGHLQRRQWSALEAPVHWSCFRFTLP